MLDAGTVVADSTAPVRVDHPEQAPELWIPLGDVAARDVLDGGGDPSVPGHVRIDPDRYVVLLSEPDDGDDALDVVRFPNWGDATDLVDVMDVQSDGDLAYVSAARADWRRPVVEGSQILGQSIVAASRHAPGRRAVSATIVLTRAANAQEPYEIRLDPVAEGRTFTALRTSAVQAGRTCAFGTVLLDVEPQGIAALEHLFGRQLVEQRDHFALKRVAFPG